MVFSLVKIRSNIQQLGQKLTADKIQQFGTKLRDNALVFGRKVSNTLGKISDVGNKLLPMAETVATGLGYGLEVLGFEGAWKGLDMINNANSNVDTLRNQGRAFTLGGMPKVNLSPDTIITMFVI